MPSEGDPICLSLPAILKQHGQNTRAYYDALRRLGGASGVFWDDDLRAWVVTGYKLCRRLLASNELSKSRLQFDAGGLSPALSKFSDPAQAIVNKQMIFDESPRAAEAHCYWRQRLRARNDAHLIRVLTESAEQTWQTAAENGAADFYRTALRPYVSRAIAWKLGLEEPERAAILPLVDAYANFLDGKPSDHGRTGEAVVSVLLLSDFVKARLQRLLCNGAEMVEDRDRWVADYVLNLVAGHESTAYALGIALIGACEHGNGLESPEAVQRLLLEALRYDSPIQLVGRVARTELMLCPRLTIRAGDKVFLHIGAANRDPGQFTDPDSFSISRPQREMLSFGWGASRCVGMNLSLLEARIFLEAARRMMPKENLRIQDVTYAHGLAGRSFDRISVVFTSSCHGTAGFRL